MSAHTCDGCQACTERGDAEARWAFMFSQPDPAASDAPYDRESSPSDAPEAMPEGEADAESAAWACGAVIFALGMFWTGAMVLYALAGTAGILGLFAVAAFVLAVTVRLP